MTELRHLHLHPGNFTVADIYLPLRSNNMLPMFPNLKDGDVLCKGFVGEAQAGTFCDLHGPTMFVLTSAGKYYYEVQNLGEFEVGDTIKIFRRGNELVAEKIGLDKVM